MAINRLQLDFSIVSQDDRAAFLETYLQQPQFIAKPPTTDELETMANYVLWGKNADGLNAKQEGLVPLETRHKTWDASTVESLEGLMESPTFNEASLSSLGSLPLKIKREVFSREEALSKCPDYLKETYISLFRQIDELDLKINYYDLLHGRRKNPPRPQLLAKFTEEEQLSFQETVKSWNQYKYLKRRHELVELRREQYTLKDQYAAAHIPSGSSVSIENQFSTTPQLDADIIVRPVGLVGTSTAPLIFREWEYLTPGCHTEEELKQISTFYWKKQKEEVGRNQKAIDFRELEHVYALLDQLGSMENAAAGADIESTLPQLVETLKFYIARAELSEVQRDILDLKLRKAKNAEIAETINAKCGKSYTTNYISTIFRQRIIPRINEAAAYHVKLLENIYFEEEFKTCSGCGRVLLKDPCNFTRKGRSKDGLTNYCKKCEKAARLKRMGRMEEIDE